MCFSKVLLGLRPRYPAQDPEEEQDSQCHPGPKRGSDLETLSELEAGLRGPIPCFLLSHQPQCEAATAPNSVPWAALRVLLWLYDLSVPPTGPSRALLLLGSPSPQSFPGDICRGLGLPGPFRARAPKDWGWDLPREISWRTQGRS